ncbi:splicing factor C9orf78 homolog [Petromyzon marinus]|uniref:Telomere length and silencing protein 1 homolog n=1 Tax=Petromyzon marinus TaxID=7757 RepID=A0AAJ7UCL5_PETMA|nr:telomere length and silencing protein 1 homolog [Petromyzon marinus]
MSASKQFRRRRDDDEEDETAEEMREKLEEMREMQKIRQRPHGVSAVALSVGKKLTNEEETMSDPFKMDTGGMVDMKRIKDRNRDRSGEDEDKDLTNLGTAFSAETNRRDEDADMMKYIETELRKRKGVEESEEMAARQRSAEDALYELPENLRVNSAKRTEEMLSNQMLSGIPEVDLGIDAKIRNIEMTEEAKQLLLAERRRHRQQNNTSFVPTNMAVNYVQHNRFSHEQLGHGSRRGYHREESKPRASKAQQHPDKKEGDHRPGFKRPNADKATDDFHYEKFRKMNRRY